MDKEKIYNDYNCLDEVYSQRDKNNMTNVDITFIGNECIVLVEDLTNKEAN